jgi:hypothetical protein
MERDHDHRYAEKCSFTAISEADRKYELSIRHQALEYNNNHRCQERERPCSPAWRWEDPRHGDDHRWFEAGTSMVRGAPAEDAHHFHNHKTTASKRHKAKELRRL